jgi:protein involved in polysaccharide export with SLBB domain
VLLALGASGGPVLAQTTTAQLDGSRLAAPAGGVQRSPRMRDGDFNVGDRIVLRVPGIQALTDTFVVRAGRVIELPQMPEIPLTGVHRSTLEHHLRVQLSRFVIDTAAIEAHALVQVGIIGHVTRPGFYAVRPDAVLSDALMAAGGLTIDADPQRITVRRGAREVLTAEQLRSAIASSKTVDDLGLRAGDEVVVGARPNWGEWVRTGALAAGVVATLVAGSVLRR